MTSISKIYIDIPVGVDYCRVYSEDCKDTRLVIDEANNNGCEIFGTDGISDIIDNLVYNLQEMMEYMSNRGKDMLSNKDITNPEKEFCECVLSKENLNRNLGFSITRKHSKEIKNAKERVKNQGLEKYVIYLDSMLRSMADLQLKIVDVLNEYESPSADKSWKRRELSEYSNSSQHCDSLLDAFYWGKSTSGDWIIVRDSDRSNYSLSELKAVLTDNGNNNVDVRDPDSIVSQAK